MNHLLFSDIKDTFQLLDTDHDGRLTKDELSTLLRYTGSLKSEAEMEELLAPIDKDRKHSMIIVYFVVCFILL